MVEGPGIYRVDLSTVTTNAGAGSHLLHFLPLTLPEFSVLMIELNFTENTVIIVRTVYNSLNPDENARTFDLA
jgi:hypothetical protein